MDERCAARDNKLRTTKSTRSDRQIEDGSPNEKAPLNLTARCGSTSNGMCYPTTQCFLPLRLQDT